MVGELHVSIADLKAVIRFLADRIVVQVADYRSLSNFAKQINPSSEPLRKFLKTSRMSLGLEIGYGTVVQLFPKPNLLVWLFVPAVRRMARGLKN